MESKTLTGGALASHVAKVCGLLLTGGCVRGRGMEAGKQGTG